MKCLGVWWRIKRKNNLIRWGIYEEKMTQAVERYHALADEAAVNDPIHHMLIIFIRGLIINN